MGKDRPIELFMPPNMLKAKCGGTIGGIDMAAVNRAESAMDTLKAEFSDWFTDDVNRLVAARQTFAADKSVKARDTLFRASHDIRGQAATFGFPLVARIAFSLCKLIEATPSPDLIPVHLIDAHVTAIRIIFRDKINDTTNKMAVELVSELEARVLEATQPNAA
jgi:chemotaxis protein histidine kinase CheA